MRTVSQYVQEILQETPLLAEVISEGIGNSAAISRLIQPDVEKRMMEPVSLQAIAMALHRLPERKKHTDFGFRHLKKITDISVRSNLVLFFVHTVPSDKRLFERLSVFEKSNQSDIQGVTRGLSETLIVVRGDAASAMKKTLGNAVIRTQEGVSSISMHLPSSSMPVPGVYYPILKAFAWEGINVVELVSAGTELTLFVEDKDVTRSLATIRTFSAGGVEK